jgi:hypothetical protein
MELHIANSISQHKIKKKQKLKYIIQYIHIIHQNKIIKLAQIFINLCFIS